MPPKKKAVRGKGVGQDAVEAGVKWAFNNRKEASAIIGAIGLAGYYALFKSAKAIHGLVKK